MLSGQPAAEHAAAARRQRVIYVRPAPHVVTLHHGGHEDESGEREAEGREGDEFDD
jgi:hypothetical protein